MHLHSTEIVVPPDGIVILPFACVHKGSVGHHSRLWGEFLNHAALPHTYTLGVGDYIDFARSSYRRALRGADVDETSPERLDRFAASEARAFANTLRPVASRCLGLLDGNHYWTFTTTDAKAHIYAGETTTQYICRLLDIPYLSFSAFLRIVCVHQHRRFRDVYTIIANHGWGSGGSTASADLGRLERVVEPTFDADAYISAHTHRRLAYFLPRLANVQGEVVERPHLLVKAGCFFCTYVQNETTYADKKMLRPVDIGWVRIHIRYIFRRGHVIRQVTESMVVEEKRHIRPARTEKST